MECQNTACDNVKHEVPPSKRNGAAIIIINKQKNQIPNIELKFKQENKKTTVVIRHQHNLRGFLFTSERIKKKFDLFYLNEISSDGPGSK